MPPLGPCPLDNWGVQRRHRRGGGYTIKAMAIRMCLRGRTGQVELMGNEQRAPLLIRVPLKRVMLLHAADEVDSLIVPGTELLINGERGRLQHDSPQHARFNRMQGGAYLCDEPLRHDRDSLVNRR